MSLSAAQLAVRAGRLGASQVAAAIGVHPYRSPLALWAELTGRAPHPTAPSDAIAWGVLLEPALRTKLAIRLRDGNPEWHRAGAADLEHAYHGQLLVYEPDHQQATIRHATYEWLMATPDDVYVDAARVPVAGGEVKNRGARQAPRWGEPGSDHLPDETLVQATIGMACLGLERWFVGAYFGGADFRVYVARYDHELMARIADRALEFLVRYVRPDRMPPVTTGDESTQATLAALFPHAGEVVASASTAEEMAVLDAYVQARSARLAAEGTEATAAARIKQVIGDRAGLRIPNGTVVRWLQATPQVPRVDYAAVLGDLAVEYKIGANRLEAATAAHSVIPPSYRRLHVREVV